MFKQTLTTIAIIGALGASYACAPYVREPPLRGESKTVNVTPDGATEGFSELEIMNIDKDPEADLVVGRPSSSHTPYVLGYAPDNAEGIRGYGDLWHAREMSPEAIDAATRSMNAADDLRYWMNKQSYDSWKVEQVGE